jgi:hypothetical protein
MCFLDCLKKNSEYESIKEFESYDLNVSIMSFTPDFKICLEVGNYKYQMVTLFDYDLSQLHMEEIKTCNQLFNKCKVTVKWLDYPKSIVHPVRICKITMKDGETLSSKLSAIFLK